jgi:hypothetical protein
VVAAHDSFGTDGFVIVAADVVVLGIVTFVIIAIAVCTVVSVMPGIVGFV